jgi:hypothetical protein
MTTFTSNNNATFGKVFNSTSNDDFQTKYEYRKPNNFGGCALVLVLLVVAVTIFTVVIPNLH